MPYPRRATEWPTMFTRASTGHTIGSGLFVYDNHNDQPSLTGSNSANQKLSSVDILRAEIETDNQQRKLLFEHRKVFQHKAPEKQRASQRKAH